METKPLVRLSQLPYFTLESYQQITGTDSSHTQSARVQLARWHKAGKVLRIKRGIYLTESFIAAHHKEADFLAMISSILNPYSYLSTTYVLQKKAILTDSTYPITAITTKNTQTIRNDLGTFTYQSIKETLYHGFTQENYLGVTFYQATTAKALFDYLYLRPLSEIARRKHFDLAAELRLNLLEFSRGDREEFASLVEKSKLPKMRNILNNLREYIWRP